MNAWLATLPVAVSGFLLLAGCETAGIQAQPASVESQPIKIGPEGTQPLAFKRVIIRVPAGSQIGAHHDGLLSRTMYGHYWNSDLSEGSVQLNIEASEQLRALGYTVLGYENLLFSEDNSSKAQFQLGGTVTALKWDTYAPRAGDYSRASMDVEWQLFDTHQRKVVFTGTTHGDARVNGWQSPSMRSAFSAALAKLTTDRSFVDLLIKRPSRTDEASPPADLEVQLIVDSSNGAKFDFATAKQSTVILRVGSTGGSGFLLSTDGYLLTAAHVVHGVEDADVELAQGVRLPARVLRRSDRHDVALLKISGTGFHALPVRLNGVPDTGTELYAIGTPLSESYSFTLTKGILSGVREVDGTPYLQTDASVNPGNSGGPLVDPDGRVVGIVSWKIVARDVEGFAFGVPIEFALKTLGVRPVRPGSLNTK